MALSLTQRLVFPSTGAALAPHVASSSSDRVQSERWHRHPAAGLSHPIDLSSPQHKIKPSAAFKNSARPLAAVRGSQRACLRTHGFFGSKLPVSANSPEFKRGAEFRDTNNSRNIRMSAAGGSGRPHSPLDPVETPRTQPGDNFSEALGRIVGHPSGSLVGALAVAAWKGITKNTAETVELFQDLPPSDLTDTVAPEALADPDSKFVDVGKVRVHYKEYTKQGLSPTEAQRLPTILLLHGFAGSTWSFRKVMADMAESLDGYRVIAFDRPPFGLTSRPLDVQPGAPDNPYTAEGAARLMLALMDTLKIDKAVAMGHSAGAPIVIDAALLAPERITALGLLAPAVFVDKSALSRGGLYAQLRLLYTRALLSTPGVGLNYIRQMYRKRRAEVNKGAMTYADADKVTNEDIEGYLKPMMAHDWDRASLLQFQSFSFEPVGDRIKDVKVPVLILQGDLDKAVPVQAARSLAGVLRNVTDTSYVELDNCGHQPMEEFPEVFVEKVTHFLQSLPDKVPAARGTPRKEIDLDAQVPVSGPDVTSVEAAPTSL